ncbi:MAG: DUF4040 domain-containing protein [Oscillospiraceae bacterium]|nr:DUF4040 domain-containing protein [Oscillospiraceae bacterium]
MIYAFLTLWIVGALLIIRESKIIRMIIYLGIFSLISSVCFYMFGAPDVAIAEAAISVFSTVFFIVCFEKHFGLAVGVSDVTPESAENRTNLKKYIPPVVFTIFLFVLFIFFIPENPANSYLKDQYLSLFSRDVGGENSVTSIYLGYRVYDTLFEALMLLVGIVSVTHLSRYCETSVKEGKPSDINRADIAVFTIRVICPVMLLFGIYLILNGHISPGGGFQGGAAIASFFVCRYMIYDIYDIPIERIIMVEKIIYVVVVLLAVLFIFIGLHSFLPLPQSVYLITMNLLIGAKVTCGLIIIFYRFIAFERR